MCFFPPSLFGFLFSWGLFLFREYSGSFFVEGAYSLFRKPSGSLLLNVRLFRAGALFSLFIFYFYLYEPGKTLPDNSEICYKRSIAEVSPQERNDRLYCVNCD